MYTEMYSDNLLCLTIRKALCLLARVRASQPFSLSLSRLLKVLCRSVNARHFPAQMELLADCDKQGLVELIVTMEGGAEKKGEN